MEPVDTVALNFNPTTLTLLNVLIGFIMFGVALDIRTDDFRRIVRDPRGPAIGLVAQFLLLPALTFVLVGIAAMVAMKFSTAGLCLAATFIAPRPALGLDLSSARRTRLDNGLTALALRLLRIE